MNQANISDINSELNQLGMKYQKRFPKSNFFLHFMMLSGGAFMGLHLSKSEIKQILKKCLKEDKRVAMIGGRKSFYRATKK